MVFQESRPHQHIRDMRVRRDMLRVSLARSNGAEMADSAAQRSGRNRGGIGAADGVEDVLEVRGNPGDAVNYVCVVVVEDTFGAVGSDEVGVARTAGCDYFEAEEGGQLDGVETDAC